MKTFLSVSQTGVRRVEGPSSKAGFVSRLSQVRQRSVTKPGHLWPRSVQPRCREISPNAPDRGGAGAAKFYEPDDESSTNADWNAFPEFEESVWLILSYDPDPVSSFPPDLPGGVALMVRRRGGGVRFDRRRA